VPAPRINAIVLGKRAITADTALRLGRYFGMEPEFWMHLQDRYELDAESDALGDRLDVEVRARRGA
jgi:addiction module HigA family antidote